MRSEFRIKKIIYLVSSPFSRRDHDRFGVDIVKNNGFDVEVWDLTPIIDKETYKATKVPDPVNYKQANCRLFLNRDDLNSRIKEIDRDSLIITMFGIDYKTYFLFRELSKSGILYALFHANTIPLYKSTKGSYSTGYRNGLVLLFNRIKAINISKFRKIIFESIWKNLLRIQPPAFILAGGSQTITNYRPPIGEKTKIIWGHTLDYDLYLKDLRKPSISVFKDKDYAVFIDGYWPFYPDYIRMKVKSPVSPDNYYPLLCKFFSDVEKETGLEVIIAAHPRSNYDEHPDYFKGRKTIRGKTRELIKNSKLVLMHYSTSLNFAVLYNKPVVFFTTDEMEQFSIDANYVRAYSSELYKSFINISSRSKIDWETELNVDKRSYDSYREKYIKKKDTESKFFWQIVAEKIKTFKNFNNV
jgi:hypothetical protein